MKRSGGPVVVGTYLVWRRGPMVVRLVLSVLGVVLAGLVAAWLIGPLASGGTFILGLALLTAGTGAVLWRVWRHARTSVRAAVGPAGLSLEPVRGGEPYTWRWSEVRLRRGWNDDDDTLTITADRTGTLLLKHDGTRPLDALVRSIRAHGGKVDEDVN